MNATSGRNGSDSSMRAGQPSFSESRSLVRTPSEKQCKACLNFRSMDSFRKHNRGGYRGICRACERKQFKASVRWATEEKRQYERNRRMKMRGFRLTMDAKRRAKDKGIPFSLDWRQIQKKIDAGTCEVTGFPFDLTQPHAWNAPSLDQIIPGTGYTPENTRVVLFALNTMAGKWGFSMILKIADALRAKGIR